MNENIHPILIYIVEKNLNYFTVSNHLYNSCIISW